MATLNFSFSEGFYCVPQVDMCKRLWRTTPNYLLGLSVMAIYKIILAAFILTTYSETTLLPFWNKNQKSGDPQRNNNIVIKCSP